MLLWESTRQYLYPKVKIMICKHCNKQVHRALRLTKCGKVLATEFCTYKCYLKFWKGTDKFIPLPEYKD